MFKFSLPVVVSVLMLSGCGADEEPYNEVPKDEKMVSTAEITEATTDSANNANTTNATSDVGTQKRYLYSRSVGKAPRYSTLSSMSLGKPKVVTLHKTERGIEVHEIDRDNIGMGHDTRYTDNIDQAPVIIIPGSYIDFKCAENQWNECINKEEVNNDADVTWQDKKYFIPDFANTEIVERNVTDFINFGKCVTPVGKPVLVNNQDEDGWKGYEMDLKNGVINFEIEHSYQVNDSCIGRYVGTGVFKDLSFTSTEFISIVAMDELINPSYTPIPYAQTDQLVYGFFADTHTYRDPSNSKGQDGYTRTYLNRWDPTRKEITYYLSNNFYEPANKAFLDAATESITIINIQNKLYQTGLPHIKIEQAKEKRFGDLRYTHITLFDEPLDNNLAGFGPFVSNPLTGEIVSASVNQYSANLQQAAVIYYRHLMLDFNQGRLDAKSVKDLTGADYVTQDVVNSKAISVANAGSGQRTGVASSESASQSMLSVASADMPAPMAEGASLEELLKHSLQVDDFASEHNMMTSDMLLGSGNSLRELPKGVKGHEINWKDSRLWVDGTVGGKLLDYHDIDIALQKEITTKIAAVAFIGTLTHETGHTFGLRHNFAGSRDQANFYTDAEVEKMNAAFAAAGYPDITARADFSSQMDYNQNNFSSTYGKYDLAALKFGYARKVEAANGSEVSLLEEDEKRRKELKSGNVTGLTQYGVLTNIAQDHDLHVYQYCTDENVALTSNCNRFDTGSNNAEIAADYIRSYFENYDAINTRYNHSYFLKENVVNYIISRLKQFNNIRQFIEDVSATTQALSSDVSTLHLRCKADPSLVYCDRLQAMDEGADFFLKVAGLGDVILHYGIIEQSNPGKLVIDPATGKPMINTVYLSQLLEKYQLLKPYMNAYFKPGEIITTYDDNPEVLTELIRAYFELVGGAELGTLAKERKVSFKVITTTGHFLNSQKAPEMSPNHPYANSVDVLGMWPDKLLAVRSLVSRNTQRDDTDRGFLALVDIPEVGSTFKAMLCQMTMGTMSINLPSSDWACPNDKLLANYYTADAISDYADLTIEPVAGDTYMVPQYFGFSTENGQSKGQSSLLHMMLKQVQLASVDTDVRGEKAAREWREYVGVHMANSQIAIADNGAIVVDGRNYAATEQNVLALKLIRRVLVLNQILSDSKLLTQYQLDEAQVKKQIARDELVITFLPVLDE